MYENEKVISFSKLDDVQEVVNAASKCDFEIDVKYNRTDDCSPLGFSEGNFFIILKQT